MFKTSINYFPIFPLDNNIYSCCEVTNPAYLNVNFSSSFHFVLMVFENITFYYIDTSVLLENTPLLKFIRNHIRDLSTVFSISSLVKISIISLISSWSLKLLKCMIEASSGLLSGLPRTRKSSAISLR